MSTPRRFLEAVLVLTILAGCPSRARAAVDVGGAWLVSIDPESTFHLDVVQTGFALEATWDFFLPADLTGRIVYSATGAFLLDGNSVFGPVRLGGVVAPDGRTFTANLVLPFSSPFPVTGSRCGNGLVDPWEQCDDGNISDRDCCSPTCAFDDADVACGPNDACATSTCDGAGLCILRSTLPDGEACDDANACSVGDTCAAGACQSGAPRQCGDCEYCDPIDGCIVGPRYECVDFGASFGLGRTSLRLSANHDDSTRLSWKIREGDDWQLPGEFGDPTSHTDYQLCVFSGLSFTSAVAHARIPGGAECDAGGCWRSGPRSVRFQDRRGRFGGITSIRLRADSNGLRSLDVRAGGAALGAPQPPVALPFIAQLAAPDGACWSTFVDIGTPVRRNDDREFHATFPIPPPRD